MRSFFILSWFPFQETIFDIIIYSNLTINKYINSEYSANVIFIALLFYSVFREWYECENKMP